MRMTSQWQ